MTDNIVSKAAQIRSADVTEEELAKINRFALTPLTAEEVFTFKVMMADNEQDDRNFEPFTASALEDLKALYIGKTMLFDHSFAAESQTARVYDTELVTTDAKTALGEPHTELIGKVYMVKTASNADLISEIKAGIKKEVSTSCSVSKMTCSVCGKDNAKTFCQHLPGRKYNGETCHMRIERCKEAYELSFVAVPAQPRAGVAKSKSLLTAKSEAAEKELRARIALAEIQLRGVNND